VREVSVSAGGRPLCRAEVAENPLTRSVGLLGRKGLAAGRGLWIKPCSSIHTLFMRFTIDVLYLDRENKMVKVRRRMRPFRMSMGGKGAHSVIELAAGALDGFDLAPGDQVEIGEG